MSADSLPTPCRFVWHELITSDPAAARAFYGRVVGWGADAAPEPNSFYTLLTQGGIPVAGLMAQPNPEVPTAWRGFVGVADVDESSALATRLGGTVHVAPQDIPNVGRFAVIADPQGAAIFLFRPNRAEPAGKPAEPIGRVVWNELHTSDWKAAFAFYERMFGWTKVESFDMGALGTYEIFATGDVQAGGMFNSPTGKSTPHWLYYIAVDDIDAAVARVGEAGGKVTEGPHPVPGGSHIIQGTDPQGILFALVGPRKQG